MKSFKHISNPALTLLCLGRLEVPEPFDYLISYYLVVGTQDFVIAQQFIEEIQTTSIHYFKGKKYRRGSLQVCSQLPIISHEGYSCVGFFQKSHEEEL